MNNEKGSSENGEGLIGFLSEATGKKKHLSKGKNTGKKSASGKKESRSEEPGYAFKIPKAASDINKMSSEHIPEFDMSSFRRFSSCGKVDYKKPKDYSTPEYTIPDWVSYSVDNASENEEPEKAEITDKFGILGIKKILMIFAVIMLACILASATVALLLFFSTPAGRTVSVLVFVVLFLWMKKKGWLPF